MATAVSKKYAFSAFDQRKLSDTRKQWTKEAASGLAFPSDTEQTLDWVEKHLLGQDGDSTAYGVFPAAKTVAIGICEVVIRRQTVRSAWVKLLRLRLQPALEQRLFETEEVDALKDALEVFVSAIVGVIRLKNEHQASTLKIFGRTSDQLRFLKALAVTLQERVKTHDVKIDGRWLVITNK